MAIDLSAQEIFAMSDRSVMHTYGRFKLAFARGQGARLYDVEGRSYLDLVSGLAVTSLGHGHPKLKKAIVEAAETLIHTSNLFYIPPQAELAAALTDVTPFDRVFFSNSGAEANEAAIKLARRYHVKTGNPGRYEVITAHNSFHGRTLATVTATGQPKYHAGFEPLPAGFRYVPLNDLDALKAAITEETAAVMLEPIQGEGGVYPCTREYLEGVRKLCDDNGLLLIFDEVQTGVGRTGTFLAAEQFGVFPDICSLAKGLGGGVPIGATLATEEAAKGFEPGSHASTFGGNFLATRAALAVMEVLFEDRLLERVPQAAQRLRNGLVALSERCPDVFGEVRGLGLMIGVELKTAGSKFLAECLKRGVLVNVIGDKILRLLPPFVVSDAEIDEALHVFELAGKECAS